MVYVALIGRGDLQFRLAPAAEVAPGIFELTPAEMPPEEDWMYTPGERVYVERKPRPDGTVMLIAVAPAPPAPLGGQ
jgi:hypothetical protein